MTTDKSRDNGDPSDAPHKRHIFPLTHWSEIRGIRGNVDIEQKRALDFLAKEYWKPIYCFVISLGVKEQEASDLVQGFFAFAIERGTFSQADPQLGRFRSFLCASVKHYVYNEWRNAQAQKRAPRGGLVSLHDSNKSDGVAFHPKDHRTPEEAFDRAWMEAVIERAARAMAEEYRTKGMELHYAVFENRYLKPLLRVAEASAYADLAKRFGISEKKIDTYLITSRRRFRSLVQAEIEKYAHSKEIVREELNLLFELIEKG
jgi:RNA polymerase sigma-70 factor (ECF subfamily)